MPRILIVAYGNPMRGDDGVAWRAADQLAGRLSSAEVEIARHHQLAPELAETVSRFESVIFVDAAAGELRKPGEIYCTQVTASESSRFSHQLSPGSVIALAQQLFRASPRALSITLTGQCFDHGESLSPPVAAALPALLAKIESLVQSMLSDVPIPPAAKKA